MAFKLVTLTIFMCVLFIPGEYFFESIIIKIAFDLLHYPFFLIFSLYSLTNVRNKLPILYVIASIIILVELIQPFFGRSASIIDMFLGEAGLITAYVMSSKIKYKLVILSIIISSYLMLVIYSIHQPIVKYINPERLGTFEWPGDKFGWRYINHIGGKDLLIIHDEIKKSYVLEGKKLDNKWSGLTYEWSIPIDPSSYKELCFDFLSESHFKVLDVRMDFIEGGFIIHSFDMLRPAWQKLCAPIPNTDKLQSSGFMKSISIYFESSSGPEKYAIDNVIVI